MTQQIVLFVNVSIAENLSKSETIEYLKKYCIIDDLGDTIYVKKLCNKTTFVIDYTSDKIYTVKKIKDDKGDNLDEILFDNDGYCCDDIDCEDNCCNDIDESRCRCDDPCYDETESQCVICGGN